MATLKEIKTRIGGVKSTQKITKAMKMVAAAKLRRAQERIMQARPYAQKIDELLKGLLPSVDTNLNVLLEKREVKNKLVVVVTSDRGLAGSFNTNLLKYAYNHIGSGINTKVITVGRKSNDSFKKSNLDVIGNNPNIFQNLSIEVSNDIVNDIVKRYISKEVDEVEIIYNEFVNVAKQIPRTVKFLPFTAIENKTDEKKAMKADFIYEPSAEAIVNTLIPKQLNVQLWKTLLESNAAEQAARMTAMETATRNASDLLKILELSYNQARQAAITTEILEIVGGAEALKDA